MSLLKLQGVSKIFKLGETHFQALNNISIEVNKGEFMAIVGPSGSGKSTLMNILGLLDRPTSGTYHIEDQDVSKLSDDKLATLRNKMIGFVFQNFNLLPRTSALDNVALPLIYSGVLKTNRENKALKMLKRVELADKINSKPNQLSGGEQQRVAIARALVTDPEVVLADEPTGNLDSKTGAQILELLKDLNKEGKTVILITHDPNIAKSAGRKIIMKDGEVT